MNACRPQNETFNYSRSYLLIAWNVLPSGSVFRIGNRHDQKYEREKKKQQQQIIAKLCPKAGSHSIDMLP